MQPLQKKKKNHLPLIPQMLLIVFEMYEMCGFWVLFFSLLFYFLK